MNLTKWVKQGIIVAAVGSSTLSLFAQNQPTPTTVSATRGNFTSSIEIPPSQALSNKSNTPVLHTFNLDNADIRGVTDEVSRLTSKSFLISPDLQGKLTVISQQPMTTDEIYQVYLSGLQLLGFSAVPAGSVIKIVKAQNANESAPPIASGVYPGIGDEVVIRVVPVNNIPVAELQSVLRPLVPDSSVVTPYAPANSVILAGYANNMSRLVDVIHDLDDRAAGDVEVVPLFNASADKIVSTLNALEGPGGSFNSQVKLAADTQNNNVLIKGNASIRKRYKKLIQKLDVARNTGSGGTEVIHLNYLQAKDVAPVLAKIAQGSLDQLNNQNGSNSAGLVPVQPVSLNATASGPNGTVSVSEESNDSTMVQALKDTNALIISAPAAVMTSLNTVIRQLDVPPREVLVEAIIAKIDQNTINNLGIVWGTSNAESTNVDASGNVVQNTTFQEGVGYIPHGNIRAIVHLLQQDVSSDLLATPTIVVLDNNDAMINDGKNIGIQDQQYAATAPGANAGTSTDTGTQTGSSIPFTTFNRKDVTLQLKVTPQISPNNTVRLKIDEQDNTLVNPDTLSTNPQFNVSNIKTSVLVKDGSILVLGGLVSHDQEKSLSKIPILGDFPIIGNLFKHRVKNIDRKDLMVFIRPVILRNQIERVSVTKPRYIYMRDVELNKAISDNVDIPTPPPVLPELYAEPAMRIPAPFRKKYELPANVPAPFEN